MRNVILLGVIAFFSLRAYGQNNDLKFFFISSNPEMHLDESVYLSFLYQFHGDSLYILDTLTSGKNMVSKIIRVYPEKEITFYYEESLHDPSDNYLLRINHRNVNEKRFIRKFNDKLNPWPISVLLDNKIYFNLNEKIKSDNIEYIGYSESLDYTNISINDFKNSYLSGSPSYPLKDVDKQLFVLNKDDTKLRIPVTRDITMRPSFPLEVPENYKLNENRRVVAFINNSNYFLLKFSSTEDRSEGVGESLFLIYSKSTNKWMELKVPGNQTRMQGFENWVVGALAEKDKEEKRVSPGYNFRKHSVDIYGPGFDIMAKVTGLYYPGKLLFFNIQNEKYFEISTNQGDSEVLLIKDDIVIYRICDEIHQAPIKNNSGLGKSKLLIKDPRVYNIHWAFTSKK